MSEIYVQQIKGPTTGANANTITVPTGQILTAPGHVLQVQQTYFQTQVVYSTNNGFSNVTDLNCVITPKSATSKIFITINFNYSCSNNGCGHGLSLDREIGGVNSGDIARGLGGANADVWTGIDNNFAQPNSSGIVMNACGNFLDSPNTTSTITYKPKVYIINGGSPIKMNRSNGGQVGAASTLTLMEIAQ